jgi:hypothetical protein
MRFVAVSNFEVKKRILWRACEGQTKSYVAPLVDSTAERDVLEEILERSKPPRPRPSLEHFLLFTPFRYCERTPGGSRFVRHAAQCAMYAAEHEEVCMAESGHWAFHNFIAKSEGLHEETINLRTCFKSYFSSLLSIKLIMAI